MKTLMGKMLMDAQKLKLLEKIEQVERLEGMAPKTRSLMFRAISAYVDYLVTPNARVQLAGPVAGPLPGARLTTSFNCPNCGKTIYATTS